MVVLEALDAIKVDCIYRESDFQSPNTTFLPLDCREYCIIFCTAFLCNFVIFVRRTSFLFNFVRICSGAQVRSSDHIFELGPKVEPPRVCSFIIETTLSRLGREISMRAPDRFYSLAWKIVSPGFLSDRSFASSREKSNFCWNLYEKTCFVLIRQFRFVNTGRLQWNGSNRPPRHPLKVKEPHRRRNGAPRGSILSVFKTPIVIHLRHPIKKVEAFHWSFDDILVRIS